MTSRLLALFVLSVVAFGIGRIAPGDPAEILLRAGGDTPTAEAVAVQRERLGLDDPLWTQYSQWLGRLACCLDGGRSFQTGRPLRDELVERTRNTLVLAGAAAVAAMAAVMVLVAASAWRDRGLLDGSSRALAAVCVSIPSFVVGLVLIDVFAVRLRWLPSSGSGSWRHVALPALTLAIATWANPYRLLRSEVQRTRPREFVTAMRARGLPPRHVILRGVVPYAIRPNLHVLGATLARLLAGSVVVETVFAWPGLGWWALDAIERRDYPVLQSYVMVVGTGYVVVNLLTDLAHRRLDPRPRHA